MTGLLEELKRRNVFKVGTAYVVLSWLLAQAADLAADTFDAPDWVMKMLVTLLALLFPLVLFLAWAYELTPEGIKKEKDVDRSQSITHHTGRKLDFTIIGILIVALGYFVWESRFEQSPPGSDSNSRSDTVQIENDTSGNLALTPSISPSSRSGAAASGIQNEKSIAVLPFVNMSQDANNEYFSDGISEEILNALAKVKELKVAGRTSSFAFKGMNQDLREIGETLGVAHILEGSVRKSGDTVRITAQLIQVNDGFHLWSESYDRKLDDVFAIQDEISAAILTELKAHLLDEQPLLASERTNSKAYDLYLLARQRLYERKSLSIASAAELLDQAIAADPVYAPAYALRGVAALLMSDRTYGSVPLEASQAEGRRYFEKALALDPQSAEALAGMGLYYYRQLEYEQSAEILERALAINPNLIDASNWLQNTYQTLGKYDQSFRILQNMIEQDPLYAPALGNMINAYNVRGMKDEAVELLDRVQPYLPGDPIMLRNEASIYSINGEAALAQPIIEIAVAQQPENGVIRFNLSLVLLETLQFERLAEEGAPEIKLVGLERTGRSEEALIMAEGLADDGNVYPVLNLLNMQGKYQQVITYIESRWPDLDQFERSFPPGNLFGAFEMTEIAYAYAQLGQQAQFADAMRRIRKSQDLANSMGANNRIFYMFESSYYAMAGDRERAIDYFEQAVDRGQLGMPRVSEEWPMLKALDGDPRFEAARQRMVEHLNRERIAMGLEPVSA